MLPMVRAALLSAALLLPSLPAHAQTPIAAPAAEEPSMEVMKSFGCLAGGTTGTIAAIGFGPENLVNLVSGGIVSPANSAVLAIGIVGVVFASFCTVGESLTPSVLYMADRAGPTATRIANATIAATSAALDAAASAAQATGAIIADTIAPALATADTALAATAEGLDSLATATTRLAATALATASEAIDTATNVTLSPTAWADAGWNALADLCRQSSLCRTRVIDAPAAPSNIATR